MITDTWDLIFLLVKEVSLFFSPSPPSSSARLFLLGDSDGEPFCRDKLRLDSPKLNFDLDLPSLRPGVLAVPDMKLFFLPDFLLTDLKVCVPCSL